MYLIGLTGGIATGKSTVSDILKRKGCKLIDADVLSREALNVGTDGYFKVKNCFGSEVLTSEGTIDRQKLGAIVFTDIDKRRLLNSIVHPYVTKMLIWQTIKALFQGYKYVILDIPLLIESKSFLRLLSEVVVVYCNPDIQLSRLMDRNGYTKEEAQARIVSQLPIDDKRRFATHPLCLIDNSGERDSIEGRVLALKHHLDASWKSLRNRLTFLIMFLCLPMAAWVTWGRLT